MRVVGRPALMVSKPNLQRERASLSRGARDQIRDTSEH